jgi:hypothetical protein
MNEHDETQEWMNAPMGKPKEAKPDLNTLTNWCNSVELKNVAEGEHNDLDIFWICKIGNIEVKDRDIYEAVRQCDELAKEQMEKK